MDIDKNIILKRFPTIEHSYMNISDMKVHNADFIMAIPRGIKCYLWFTYYEEEYIACICYLGANGITEVKKVLCCFDSTLCSGTILYGTIFHYRKKEIFYIENICYYKGKNIVNDFFSKKLNLLTNIFESELNIEPFINEQMVIGMALFETNFSELNNKIEHYPVKINNIRYITKNTYVNQKYTPHGFDMYYNSVKVVFKIKADIQNDIYSLYCFNNGNFDNFVDIACIPDYKTSVFMNTLFRYIKENENLDYQEESDSDNEFENIDNDRFVNLEKSYNIQCVYNHRFKKWVPLKVVKNNKIVNLKELGILRRKNYQIVEKSRHATK